MTLKLKLRETSYDLTLSALRPVLVVDVDGAEHTLAATSDSGRARAVEIDGRRVSYRQARSGNTVFLHVSGRSWTVDLIDPRDATRDEAAGSDQIRAPMPGLVVSVEKQPGETVRLGETLITIESMKLQTNLTAPRDGTLGAILKGVGDTFEKDEVVAMLEAEADDA